MLIKKNMISEIIYLSYMVCTVFSYGEGINTSQSHFSYILMCKNENLMNKLFLIILAFSMRAMTFGKKRESPYFLKI